MLTFFRAIKFAGQSFFRNIWLSIVTIVMIVLSLLSISSIYTLSLITENTLNAIEQATVVYIDLTAQATDDQSATIVKSLKELEMVKDAEIVSKDEALESFKSRHQNDQLIIKALESLSSNPFTGSIRLSVNNIDDFPTILKELSKPEFANVLAVDDQEFSDSKLLIEKLSGFSNKMQKGGLILSIIFMIIAILVVYNTIQVAIYTHREEIGIMKLVGASNMFIRSPFLIEAGIYCLTSIIIQTVILYLIFIGIQPYLTSFLQQYSVSLVSLFAQNWQWYVIYQFIVCLAITMLSAYIATRKYLKN